MSISKIQPLNENWQDLGPEEMEELANFWIWALSEYHDLDSSAYWETDEPLPDGRLILAANWNGYEEHQKLMMEVGHETVWSDTVVRCDNGKFWSTEDYHKSLRWMITEDGEILTKESPLQDWIDEVKVTDKAKTPKALPDWFGTSEIVEAGFELVETRLQSGLYGGKNDEPQEISEKLFDLGYIEVLFQIDSINPFQIGFVAYAKRDKPNE